MAKKSQSGNKFTSNLYEDFHPISEWKEEPENNILLVHIPDFGKEQIHIACVRSSRIVRVTAERQVADSKWSGCNEAFPIPENCKVDKIHAKWQNGTLTITMPKETITLIQPQPKTTQIELESPKPVASNDYQKAASPKAAAEHLPKYEKKSDDDQMMKRDKQADNDEKKKSFGAFPKAAAETKPQNVEQVAKKEVKTATEKKGFQAAAAGDDDDDGKKEKKSDDQMMKRDKQADNDEKKKSFGAFPKAAAETKLPQNDNVEQMRKKEVKTATEKKGFKAAAAGDDDDDGKKDGIARKTKKEEKKSRTAAAMKAVKEMAMEQNEDKQLMINMGVAVLVIVALGAYVSYSNIIGSKSKD